MNAPRLRIAALAVVALLSSARGGAARVWHVSPQGTAEGDGSLERPLDLAPTLDGRRNVAPGDTVLLLAGTYRHPQRDRDRAFQVKLEGDEDRPIHVRPAPGERATIDGRVEVVAPTSHLWMWDLELTVSEVDTLPRDRRRTDQTGPHPKWEGVPSGGLRVYACSHSKFINLLVHDNFGPGVSFWQDALDSELYGCLVFDNGWMAPDRYHGPAIYTQNRRGLKRIADCLLFANYSSTIQAYGSSRAWVDGYRIAGNIAFDPLAEGGRERILVGGGRPSRDIVVRDNVCHRVPIQVGYGAAGRQGKEIAVTGNVIVDA